MTDTRQLFDRALADEPPLGLTLEPVVAAGRRVRRRRRIAYGACALSLSAVAVAGAVPLLGGDGASMRPAGPGASAQAGSRQQVDPRLTPEQRAIAQAIIDNSPADWRFDLSPERWDRLRLDGTVDDGTGKTRLLVFVYTARSTSPEGGQVTAKRTVHEEFGTTSVTASLVNDDGGVLVDAMNAVLRQPVPTSPPEDKRGLHIVVRDEPPYTVDQVGEIARAIARALGLEVP